MYDDMTGSDWIQLRQDCINLAAKMQAQLEEHNVKVADVYINDTYNHMTYEKVYKVAIGFESQEDLVMAKLILKCNDLDL